MSYVHCIFEFDFVCLCMILRQSNFQPAHANLFAQNYWSCMNTYSLVSDIGSIQNIGRILFSNLKRLRFHPCSFFFYVFRNFCVLQNLAKIAEYKSTINRSVNYATITCVNFGKLAFFLEGILHSSFMQITFLFSIYLFREFILFLRYDPDYENRNAKLPYDD